MTHLIAYLLAAFGLAYIVGHSAISLPIRNWIAPYGAKMISPLRTFVVALAECPACIGFWIGGFVWTFDLAALSNVVTFSALEFALMTSGSNFVLGRLTGLIKDE